ncbi:MAG: hypothetical protein M0T69_02205 [Deltaproteobacteria bacterium]|nr:hypothetical protein [Deltaproteobacteria bacterium]
MYYLIGLVVLAAVVAAGYYGWKRYTDKKAPEKRLKDTVGKK